MFQLWKSDRKFVKTGPIVLGEFGEIVTGYISFMLELFYENNYLTKIKLNVTCY